MIRTYLLPIFGVFIASFCLAFSAPAQSGMDLIGSARATALGHATTALQGDVGSHANPAAAATAPRFLQLFAYEAFGLADLRRGGISLAIPWRSGALHGGLGAFGSGAYREWYGSLGAAYQFGFGTTREVLIGARLRYYHTGIDGYGQSSALGLSLGSQVRLLPTLSFGASAINVNAPEMTEGADLPQILAIGLAYEAAPDVMIVLDVMKDIDFPLSVRGGLEVQVLPPLALRAGYTTEPSRFTAGAGIALGRLSADVAAEQHQALGWSPAVGLGIQW
jgi:hypothetical protein